MSNLDDFQNNIQPYLDSFGGMVIFDNGIRSADEISEDIINLARGYGFYAFDEPTFQDKMPDENDEDYSENISYLMDEAIEYLSEGVPDGYWIGNDGYAGAFGIWRCEDE